MSNPPSVLSFNGTKDYIEVPYKPELNPPQFTVSCWAKVKGGQGQWRSPLTSRTAKGSTDHGGYILYAGTNNQWQFWIGNGSQWITLTGADITLNTWTHVCATYDGSTMKLYINGELSGKPVPSKIKINTTYPLRIGTGATEGRPNYFFNGQITEVSIWNTVRSPEEIKLSMNQRLRGDEPGLVGYWPLNEGTGTTVNHPTLPSNQGTINGATWQQEPLDFLQPPEPIIPLPTQPSATSPMAISFDGQKDYIEIPTNPSLDLINDFTIEAWIKPELMGKRVVDKGIGGQSEGFTFDTYPQNLRFINKGVVLTSRNPLKVGTWQHVAITFKNEANGAKLYINGQEEQTATPTTVGTVTKLPVRIASQADALGNLFKGQIAEVRMWNRVRSQEEIQQSMHQRLRGNEAGLVGYWPLNEGTGNTAQDQTPQKNSGTIQGGTWQPTTLELTTPPPTEPESPKDGPSCLSFDGIDDYVPTAVDAQPSALPATTWEAWVKPTRRANKFERIDMILSTDDGGWDRFVSIYKGKFCIAHGSQGWNVTEADLGKWQHIAVVYTAEQGIKFYKNGTEFVYQGKSTIGSTKHPLYIGGSPGYKDQHFQGSLAEVRVWDYGRELADIQRDLGDRLTGNEPGLVAYWPLDEGTGTTITDKTGHGYDSPIQGAIWEASELELAPAPEPAAIPSPEEQEITTPVSSALKFDGVDDYVTMPMKAWEAPVFSVELWARASQNQVNYASLLSNSDDPSVAQSCQIDVMGGYYRFYHSDVQVRFTKVSQEWLHLAVTYDGQMVQTYVNGEPQYSKSMENMETVFRDYLLGRSRSGDKYFAGELSEVRIWQKVLTEEQIKAGMARRLEGNEPGLVAYWPLNEGKGDAIANKTGNTQPGNLHGATWQSESVDFLQVASAAAPPVPDDPMPTYHGLTGNESQLTSYWSLNRTAKGLQTDRLQGPTHCQPYLHFNGQGDYIDTNTLLNLGTEPFTLEAWIYSTGTSGVIFSAEKQGVSAYQFRLAQENNDILFMFSDGPGNTLLWDSKTRYWLKTTIANHQWSHIAIKRLGTIHQMYVNGILTAHAETSEPIDWKGTIPFRIGAQHSYSQPDPIFPFQGKIADVRLWNSDRSEEDIRTQREYELTGKEPGLLGYWPLNEGKTPVSDRTGKSQTTLYGGTWETEEVSFLTGAAEPTPTVSEPPSPLAENAKVELESPIVSLTVLTDHQDLGGKPKTIYGKSKSKSKKHKKRKKQAKWLAPYEKLVREVAKRQDRASHTYVQRHQRSNRKKKNGWIRDFVKNSTKSFWELF